MKLLVSLAWLKILNLEYSGVYPGFHTDEEVTVVNVYKTLLKGSYHTAVLDMA
jgi:hypothetical protein